jgi:hypothetical protein
MLDCPEAIQTSPTRMSLSVTFLPVLLGDDELGRFEAGLEILQLRHPLAVLAGGGGSLLPANSTVTFVPGLLQPQTGTVMPRWRMA